MKSRCQRLPFLVCLIVVSMSLAPLCWAEQSIQISEKDKKIVLTGEISKALGRYDEHLQGAVEYLVCGKGGKEYESIIVVDSTAKEIHDAMLKLGVERGSPPTYDEEQDREVSPSGESVLMFVEWETDGKTKRIRAEELVYNVQTEKPMKHVAWIFSGARMVPDLESDDLDALIPQAFMSNDVAAFNHLDGSALFQNPLLEAAEENTYKKNDKQLPPLGTPVKLTIEVNQNMQLHILISGGVQGVGFRDFTRRSAEELGVRGYAKNLANGNVEVVAEGDKVTLDEFVMTLRQGPPSSKVDDARIEERQFSGKYEVFEIKF